MTVPLHEQYKMLLTLPAFCDFRHELDRELQQMKEEFWSEEPEGRAQLETKIEHYGEFLGAINKILLDKQKH